MVYLKQEDVIHRDFREIIYLLIKMHRLRLPILVLLPSKMIEMLLEVHFGVLELNITNE